MQLTTEPDVINWPESHYVFLEKVGPFQNTAPQAWKELHELLPAIVDRDKVMLCFSQYCVERQIYRAGVSVAAAPAKLPSPFQYEKLKGGKYSRFVLTGSYANLPEASGRVFHIVKEKKIPLRTDFNIENYVNNPKTTPEDELVTEILFPTV